MHNDYTEWKVDDLRAYAKENGISLGGATKKADIIAALEAAAAEPVEATPKAKGKAKTKKIVKTMREVFAPKSTHGRRQWSVQGVSEQLRFDRDGRATLCVAVDGDPITVRFSGADGLEDIRVDEVVARQREITLGDTYDETVEVPA